jgi:hypothetical protein
MTTQDLARVVHQKPFNPFVILMRDGKAIRVDSPDQIAFTPTSRMLPTASYSRRPISCTPPSRTVVRVNGVSKSPHFLPRKCANQGGIVGTHKKQWGFLVFP